jgi:hypothetical protein
MSRFLCRLSIAAIAIFFTVKAPAQKLYINEVSQGSSGSKEFVEFVVSGTRTCTDSTLDIRGYIFDDNPGWYTTTGVGVGCFRFANISNWSAVRYGSLIIVYNAQDKNLVLPADDSTDANGDGVYVVPSTCSFLQVNTSSPASGGSTTYDYAAAIAGTWSTPTSSSWSTSLALGNSGDAFHLINPSVSTATAAHSVSYGTATGGVQTATIYFSSLSAATAGYNNGSAPATQSAWTTGTATTSTATTAETPGAGNGTANTVWISSMRTPFFSRLYVDGSISASGNGGSWATAFKTLTEALTYANAYSCPDEIWVKAGTYYPATATGAATTSRDSAFKILRNGIKVYGGFAGTETALSQRNYATNITTLSGDIGTANDSTDNCYHVMVVAGPTSSPVDTTTVVDGFTITGGNANGGGGMSFGTSVYNRTDGGGINITGQNAGSCSPKIENCTLTHNTAYWGGGVYCMGHGGGTTSAVVRNCTFTNNVAYYWGGGYLAYGDGSSPVVSGQIISSTFTNNNAFLGGGVYTQIASATGKSFMTISSCTFTSNTATGAGGAIEFAANGGTTDTVQPAIINGTFSNNSAPTGGAVFFDNGVNASLSNCAFTGNNATSFGGALAANNSVTTTSGSSFTSNTTVNGTNTVYGGAAAFYGYSQKRTHTITGSRFTSNYCYSQGGAIQAMDSAYVVLSNDTTFANKSSQGGGFMQLNGNAGVTASNCVFNNDSAGSYGGFFRHISTGRNAFTKCQFLNGYSGSTGGVIDHNGSGSTETWTNCVFYNNKTNVTAGGAIHCYVGTDTVIQCVFANNSVVNGGGLGGAVTAYTGSASVTVYNSTFSNNLTGTNSTGANTFYVGSGGTLNLINSVASTTTASTTITGTANYSYSLVKNATVSAPSLNADPVFINPSLPMGADGIWGTTDDGLELAPCSPAVNAGANAMIPAGITADIAGAGRIQQTTVDMGAYEQGSTGTKLYVNGAVATSGNGFSWSGAFKTVSEALNLANSGCPDTIWVAAGTYYPATAAGGPAASRDSSFRILRSGIKVYGGFNGTETLLSQRNVTGNATILSGDIGTPNDSTDNCYHVFTVTAPSGVIIDSTTQVDGFTIRDGNGYGASGSFTVNGASINHQDAGGMHIYATGGGSNSLQVANCTFTRNAANFGGASYVLSTSATASARPAFANCTFSNNNATNNGGAFFNNGNAFNLKASFSNCSFSNNSANGTGGAMQNNNATITLSSCTYTGNRAVGGGGALANTTDSLVVSNCSFSSNKVTGSGLNGGAMYSTNSIGSLSSSSFTSDSAGNGGALSNSAGKWTIANCTFLSNAASTGVGGAVYGANNDVSVYSGCTFTSNACGLRGSAVYGNTDTMSFSACTFSGNISNSTSVNDGGAIASIGNAQLSVANSTFTNNSGANDRGAAVGCTGYSTITNCTFTGNSGFAGGALSNCGGSPKTMTVSNCQFTGNTSSSTAGAIISMFGSNIVVNNSSFTNNKSVGGNGGAFYAQNGGSVAFSNDTMVNNTCSGAGGAMITLGNPTTVANCIIKDNRASGQGGGIYSNGSLSVTGSVFERDSASGGGGVFVLTATKLYAVGNFLKANVSTSTGGGMLVINTPDTIVNCVFVANRGVSSGGSGIDLSTTTGNIAFVANNTFYQNTTTGTGTLRMSGSTGTMNAYNNLLWANAASSGTADISNAASGATVNSSNNFTGTDPLFVNPSNPVGADGIWGTSDDGLQLQSCSQAINTGTNPPIALFAADAQSGARIQQSIVDPGAYESPYVNSAVVPSVTISASPSNLICSGTSVVFTATPVNGGAAPVYQWLRNGISVGAAAATYTDATLANGNTVQVRMISNAACRTKDTVFSNVITMTVNPTPTVSSTSSTNPTSCGGTDGTISLNGLAAFTGYTVNYSYNGTAQTPVIISSNGSGAMVLTGLAAGSYANFTVTSSAPCTSPVVAGPIVLSPPASPNIGSTATADPTTCGGVNGTISLNGLIANTAYSVSYTANGTPQTATITANGSGVVTITGLAAGSYTSIFVTKSNCTSNIVTGPLILNPPASPVIAMSGSVNPSTCGGTSGSITLSGLLPATVYTVTYTKNGGAATTTAITSDGSGNVVIGGLAQGSYTNISVTLNNCQSNIIGGPVTLSDPPIPSAPTAGSNTPVCQGTTLSLSSGGQSGASYIWSGPNSYSSSAQNPTVTTNMQSIHAGTYSVTQTVAGCVSPAATTVVVMSTVPAAPGAISGNAAPCVGSSYTYSISPVATATSYVWTLPAGGGWSGSSSTTSVSVTAGATAGLLSVAGINGCGTGAATTLTLTPNTVPSQPGPINGPATICSGASANYYVNAVGNTSSYTWTLPVGWTGSGLTTSSVTALAGSVGGTITVTANNVCGSSSAQSLGVSVITIPAQPGSISGSTTPCVNSTQTYSIAAVSGAASYTWTYPSGGSPAWLGGSVTPAINTTVGTNSGNVTVSAVNQCGSSPARALAVAVTQLPSQPGVISGKTAPCVGASETYRLSSASTGAAYYTWTYPTGWTGVGTADSLNVTTGSSGGVITVTPVGLCGNGASRTLTVSATPVASTGVVLSRSTPTDTICGGTAVTFTATATNGGTAPQYVFRKNGVTMPSGGNTYTDYSLGNGDVVSVTMISSLPCVTQAQVRDSIRMVVIPQTTPGININTTPPITLCAGTAVTFLTNTVGGGNNPQYQWYKNGVALAGITTPSYTTNSLSSGDTLQVTLRTSAQCPAFVLAYSNKVGLTVNAVVNPSVTISASPSGAYTPGTAVVFSLTGSGGGVNASYQWVKNGADVAGETGQTYSTSSLSIGDQISVRMQSSLQCASPSVVRSNVIVLQGLSTGVASVGSHGGGSWDGEVLLYPNPGSGRFTLSARWGSVHNGSRVVIEVVSVVGQRVYGTELRPGREEWSSEIWLGEEIANGSYLVRLSTDDGMSFIRQIVLQR